MMETHLSAGRFLTSRPI